MPKIKLTSKKEVEIRDLTYAEREECEILISGTMMQVGDKMKITDPERYYRYRTKACMYGLNLDNPELLNIHSSKDLDRIAAEVLDRATMGVNPTE